jgi:hypothetical protein
MRNVAARDKAQPAERSHRRKTIGLPKSSNGKRYKTMTILDILHAAFTVPV